MLYALSVGPAIYLITRASRGASPHASFAVAEAFYSPLERASKNETIGPVIMAYARWWRELAER